MPYIISALVVAFVNVIPFFMPATWTVLSYIAITYDLDFLALSVIGAVAATAGRVTLAKLARHIIRRNFLSDKTKQNIDHLKTYVEERERLSFALFLGYAFSPLPSNQLFLAFGLTNLRLKLIAVPFFIGRLVSYAFLTFTSKKLAGMFLDDNIKEIFGAYFIIGQILLIGMLFLFTKIDWKRLLGSKKLTLLK